MFSQVDDGEMESLQTQMASYYEYFASLLVNNQPVWTEPYEFASGGRGVTVAEPVYFDKDTNPILAGVVAQDVLLGQLEEMSSSYQDLISYLAIRYCFASQHRDDAVTIIPYDYAKVNSCNVTNNSSHPVIVVWAMIIAGHGTAEQFGMG